MVELFHHHNHNPDQHDHGPTHEPTDPASRSLADALRVSFRLLSVIMVIVLVFYLLTGVKTIQNTQVGVKKVFGSFVGLAEPGLAYTWPFPIGSIEIVNTSEQKLDIDDFWMFETAAEKTQDLLSRSYFGGGLIPGRDGALLTGDRNLLHVGLTCRYVVRRVMDYATNVGNSAGGTDATAELIRSAVCKAAIRAAATHTADGLQRTERNAFSSEVRRLAQQELDSLNSGIDIVSVLIYKSTWPIGALQAYLEAQNAISKAEKAKDAARAEAVQLLSKAAGANYRKLVGEAGMESTAPTTTAPVTTAQAGEGDYDLIGQYAAARAAKNEPLARELMRRIDEVLRSRETSGEASKIISDAETASLATIQRVKSRANRFNQLLPKYEQTPELTLQNLWIAVREDILDSPSVEKYYLTQGGDKTVLKINRDPKIAAEILRWEKSAKTKTEGEK